jgi:hypothetical protein
VPKFSLYTDIYVYPDSLWIPKPSRHSQSSLTPVATAHAHCAQRPGKLEFTLTLSIGLSHESELPFCS